MKETLALPVQASRDQRIFGLNPGNTGKLWVPTDNTFELLGFEGKSDKSSFPWVEITRTHFSKFRITKVAKSSAEAGEIFSGWWKRRSWIKLLTTSWSWSCAMAWIRFEKDWFESHFNFATVSPKLFCSKVMNTGFFLATSGHNHSQNCHQRLFQTLPKSECQLALRQKLRGYPIRLLNQKDLSKTVWNASQPGMSSKMCTVIKGSQQMFLQQRPTYTAIKHWPTNSPIKSSHYKRFPS